MKNAIYLTVDLPKAGRFYLLPKFHKAENPGLPIVSANGHPIEKISEFVDLHIQPHVQNLPSYLQDTTDFLRKQDAMGQLPPETLLVSMDVTSLYTNIPHEDGIKACEEVWEARAVKDPPTQIPINLLTLFSNAIILSSMVSSRDGHGNEKWLHRMPTYLWVGLKDGYCSQ